MNSGHEGARRTDGGIHPDGLRDKRLTQITQIKWRGMLGSDERSAVSPDARLLHHRDFGIHASTAMTVFYHNGHEGTQGRIKDVGKQ